MPEIINKNVLIKILRYINTCSRLGIGSMPINFRKSTLGVAYKILFKKGLINKNNLLSAKGKLFLKKNKLDNIFECKYTSFGYLYKESNNAISNKIVKVIKSRPHPNSKLDQQPLPPQLTIMRAKYIASEENLVDRKIAFVGDYDSTNIALSMLFGNKESFIFDIDKRLLNFFEKTAKNNSYNINTVYCDIFKYKSKKYNKKFDIIVSDPPYAAGGIKRFIEFGISLLKDGGIGFLAVPYHENISWTEQILFEVTKLLVDKNCLITDNNKNFYYYSGADNLKSSMIRFKKMKSNKSIDITKLYSYKEKNINKPIVKI